MQEQSVRRKLSFYRSFPLKLLPILLDVSLPSIHRQSLLRVTSHVRSYRRYDERHARANIHIYVHAYIHTHIHISIYVASRRRDRLTCCNLEAVYCYKPYTLYVYSEKTFSKKTHLLLYNCSKLHIKDSQSRMPSSVSLLKNVILRRTHIATRFRKNCTFNRENSFKCNFMPVYISLRDISEYRFADNLILL